MNQMSANSEIVIKEKTRFQTIISKMVKRNLTMIGFTIFVLFILLAVLGPGFIKYGPTETITADRFQGPSANHLFGTDELGRDGLARIAAGARITITVALMSVVIALIIGTILGLISGYYGGAVDRIISGFLDSLWAFPTIILALSINVVLGASLRNIFIAIGIVNVPDFARIVRSRVITINKMEYVTAAKAIGLSELKIIFRYVLPNLMSTLIVQTTLCAAKAIIAEAGLSFLGLGVPLPHASWGSMLKTGFAYLYRAPWLSVFPGLFIALLVLSLNFIGDGLRDALDVRIRED